MEERTIRNLAGLGSLLCFIIAGFIFHYVWHFEPHWTVSCNYYGEYKTVKTYNYSEALILYEDCLEYQENVKKANEIEPLWSVNFSLIHNYTLHYMHNNT